MIRPIGSRNNRQQVTSGKTRLSSSEGAPEEGQSKILLELSTGKNHSIVAPALSKYLCLGLGLVLGENHSTRASMKCFHEMANECLQLIQPRPLW